MKTHSLLVFSLCLLSLFSMTSCTRIVYSLYGFKPKELRMLSDEEIVLNARKNGINSNQIFKVDSNYIQFLKNLDTTQHKLAQKNHYQPLQALYYDANGELQSFLINCYTKGFPNLKWNENGILNTFPPQQQAPLDNVLPLEKHLSLLHPTSTQAKILEDNDQHYTLIIYWSPFMGRQSKRFVKKIHNNCKLAKGQNLIIYYTYSDPLLFP